MTDREQQASDMLQNIAKDIQEKLPEKMGFVLLAYEFGDEPGRKMLYVSNSNRADTMIAMAEFIEKHIDQPGYYGKDVD